jgi:CHAD domain-containing protein
VSGKTRVGEHPLRLGPGALRLGARASVRELAAAAIAQAQAQFIANAPDAVARQTPESVHQARVGLRKLRSYVRLFRSRIGRTKAKQLDGELRWLFRLFGVLRDLQVFTRDVLPLMQSPPRTTFAFRARIDQRLARARDDLRTMAQSARFRDLCAALVGLERKLAEQRDDVCARAWLEKRLDRLRRRLRVKQEQLLRPSRDLHALRKRAKKLRYSSDLWRALGKRHTKRERQFRAALTALQDNLGALNDLRVERTLLAKAHPPASIEKRLRTTLAAAEAAHRAELANVYACFAAADPFWD